MVATLKKNTSGSIEGEAIQKDITGARGTPPINRVATTGMTPQEQKGLKAPTAVARKIATIGWAVKARLMYFAAPDICTATARGMVIKRYGQTCRKAFNINWMMATICSNIFIHSLNCIFTIK
jgi:hypothetical protein